MYCPVCRVFICEKCCDSFHNFAVPKLSPCLARNHATAMLTRSSQTCTIATSRNTPPRSSRYRPLAVGKAAGGASPAKRKRDSLQASPVRKLLNKKRNEARLARIAAAAAKVGTSDDTPALRGGKRRKPVEDPRAPKKSKRGRCKK